MFRCLACQVYSQAETARAGAVGEGDSQKSGINALPTGLQESDSYIVSADVWNEADRGIGRLLVGPYLTVDSQVYGVLLSVSDA